MLTDQRHRCSDKCYDADFIREVMERRGMAMIPTKRYRRIQLPIDPAIYPTSPHPAMR